MQQDHSPDADDWTYGTPEPASDALALGVYRVVSRPFDIAVGQDGTTELPSPLAQGVHQPMHLRGGGRV